MFSLSLSLCLSIFPLFFLSLNMRRTAALLNTSNTFKARLHWIFNRDVYQRPGPLMLLNKKPYKDVTSNRARLIKARRPCPSAFFTPLPQWCCVSCLKWALHIQESRSGPRGSDTEALGDLEGCVSGVQRASGLLLSCSSSSVALRRPLVTEEKKRGQNGAKLLSLMFSNGSVEEERMWEESRDEEGWKPWGDSLNH